MDQASEVKTAGSAAGFGSAPLPGAEQLAAQLAAKHGSGPAPAAKPGAAVNKGGRRTVAEEAAAFLERNGLVAVPADQAGGDAQPAGIPSPGPQYVVTPEFVRECTETLLEGIKEFRIRNVYLRVQAITKDDALAKELAGQACPPPGTIKVMAVAAAEISQKYNMMAAWSPELLLGVAALVWIKGDLSLNKRLLEIERAAKASGVNHEPKPAA